MVLLSHGKQTTLISYVQMYGKQETMNAGPNYNMGDDMLEISDFENYLELE